jgi:type I restriction enzyme S subunit
MELVETKKTIDKYPAYKESGEVWLGLVPEEWGLTRLGSYFKERKTKVSDKDYAPLSVTKMGILPQLSTAAKSNDGDNRKLVKKGDFVINSRSDRKGSSGIAKEDGSVSLINIVMTPMGIEPMYCNYLLKSTAFVEENYRIGHGIVADLWTTRYDEMKNIKVAIPSYQEQTAIANFLDEKTAKIDQAIAQKEKMISLLKERKQIIIQNAVTKGLDPNVKLKDSGVEWIGEIPEHWEVKRLKYVSKININSLPENTPSNYKFDYVDIGSVSFENGIEKVEQFNFKQAPSRARRIANTGDTVISTVRTYLKAIDYITKAKSLYIYSTGFAVLKPVNIQSDYLYHFVRSNALTEQVTVCSKGMSYPAINSTDLSRLFIAIPPFEQQKVITQFINNQSSKIDKTILLQQTQIQKLKEYKATLIDSAVTGKIKVS